MFSPVYFIVSLTEDACSTGAHDCDPALALCVRTATSYYCKCKPQFTGTGKVGQCTPFGGKFKGLFTPNDSVTVTLTLTGGTLDGLHTHFDHRCNIFTMTVMEQHGVNEP